MKTAAQIRREASDAQILAAMFPGMSKSTRDANAAPSHASAPPAAPVAQRGADVPRRGMSAPRQRKAMNKTEESFLALLTVNFPHCQIDREGITLRWPDGMTYTSDFVVYGGSKPLLIETKGPFIRRSGLEKFRAARARWTAFEFQMHQRDKAYNWKKIL